MQHTRCNIAYRDTLRSAVFFGGRIWSDVSWFRWLSVEVVWHGFWEASIHLGLTKIGIFESQGTVLQAPILLEGTRFIAWRLRGPFLGEYQWGSRHFGSYRACLGCRPTSEPAKKSLVPHSSGRCICMKSIWHEIASKSWYAIKLN